MPSAVISARLTYQAVAPISTAATTNRARGRTMPIAGSARGASPRASPIATATCASWAKTRPYPGRTTMATARNAAIAQPVTATATPAGRAPPGAGTRA